MKNKNYEPLKKVLKERSLVLTEKHEGNINVSEKDGFYLYNYNDVVLVPRDDPIIRLCRGLVIREDGKIMSYAFNRFFNYHEVECDEVDILNADILEKLDGSCISIWYDGNDWRVTTRGSFPPAEQGIDYNKEFRRLFNNFDLLVPGHTYIFELCSSSNRIITHYDEEFVTLIGVRDLDSLQELDQNHLDEIAARLEVRRPKRYPASNIDDCRALFEQMKDDEEGLVVVDGNFNRFKLKQESYLKMAKIMKLKNQDILDYVRGFTIIDADFNKMPEVRDKIAEINGMNSMTEDLILKIYSEIENIAEQKDFALKAVKYPFSSVLFQLRKGSLLKEIKIKYDNLERWYKPSNWFKPKD